MHHKYAITHEAKEYVQDIFQDDLLFVHVCVYACSCASACECACVRACVFVHEQPILNV